MKYYLTLVSSLAFGLIAHADSSWRTFSSPDGDRTFEGRLVAYDARTQTVTVENRQGQTIHFKEDLISRDDREYVRDNVNNLPPKISLDVRFDRLTERGETNRGGNTRTTTSDAGYKITLRNYTPTHFSNVTVDYLLIYRKDEVEGSGSNEVVRGSASVSLESNRIREIETQTVELVNFYERGKASSSTSVSGGGCGGGGCRAGSSSTSTTVTRSKRSRDFLVGCVAQVKVNGHVVSTTATAPNLVRQYASEFGGGSESDK